jgi:hypothetical protein
VSRHERLLTEGFLFEGVSIRGSNLRASYGDGYGEGVRVGHAAGLRTWKIKIGALPNVPGENLVDAGGRGEQTRFMYLFGFYLRHNVENAHKPFWVRDPVSGDDYLAEIVEEELDFKMLSRVVMSTGLTVRQRRVFGVRSPGDEAEDEGN